MSISVRHVSGTGNWLDKESRSDFQVWLKQLKKIIDTLVASPSKTDFWRGSGSTILNNWHWWYKLEVTQEMFPLELCNWLAINSRGKVQLSIRIPQKYKAPQWNWWKWVHEFFDIICECHLEWALNSSLPKEAKKLLVQEVLDGKMARYKERLDWMNKQAKRQLELYKQELVTAKEKVVSLPDTIESMKADIDKFEKKHAKYLLLE